MVTGGWYGGVSWFRRSPWETVSHWKQLSGNATKQRLQIFFKNNLTKADLNRWFNEFMKREVPRLHLNYPLVIKLEKGAQNSSPCNHEEADTRIIYHCTLEDKPTVVIASDTDILILMVHLFASRLLDDDWFLQTSLWMYLRFTITLVMELESRYQQCSSSLAVTQWVSELLLR